jgi:glycosyltransferase involved in cell wall biosynthesis
MLMKLNILLITYQHELYIGRALESLINQDIDFDYKIIVADDGSSDSTLEIISRYLRNCPVESIILPTEANLGFVKNYQRGFTACNAEYVAVLEGDDYWSKSDHCARHIRFLDKYTECSMSFNRHLRLYATHEELPEWQFDSDHEMISLDDLASGREIGNMSSCVFRNDFLRRVDPTAYELIIADTFWGVFMAQYGPVAFQKHHSSVYRVHELGLWSRLNKHERYQITREMLNSYDRFFQLRFTALFKAHLRNKEKKLYAGDIVPGYLQRIMNKIGKKIRSRRI